MSQVLASSVLRERGWHPMPQDDARLSCPVQHVPERARGICELRAGLGAPVQGSTRPHPARDRAVDRCHQLRQAPLLLPGAEQAARLLSGCLGARSMLDNNGAEQGPVSKSHCLVPSPPHRMAFLSWEFSNFCHQNKYLLGGYTMARRHLQAAGFIVVEVSSLAGVPPLHAHARMHLLCISLGTSW